MSEHRNRGSPRLQFSKEELENDALTRPIAKAEKAADKYDAAKQKLRKGHRVRLTRETVTSAAAEHPQGASAEHHSSVPVEEGLDIRTDPKAPSVQNTRQKPKPAKTEANASVVSSMPDPEQLLHETASDAAKPTGAPATKKKVLRLKFE